MSEIESPLSYFPASAGYLRETSLNDSNKQSKQMKFTSIFSLRLSVPLLFCNLFLQIIYRIQVEHILPTLRSIIHAPRIGNKGCYTIVQVAGVVAALPVLPTMPISVLCPTSANGLVRISSRWA